MRNPFKRELVQLGELHYKSDKYSDEYVTITELYDLAMKYRNLFNTEYQEHRIATTDISKQIRTAVAEVTSRLKQDIAILTDTNIFLQARIDSLVKLRSTHCK